MMKKINVSSLVVVCSVVMGSWLAPKPAQAGGIYYGRFKEVCKFENSFVEFFSNNDQTSTASWSNDQKPADDLDQEIQTACAPSEDRGGSEAIFKHSYFRLNEQCIVHWSPMLGDVVQGIFKINEKRVADPDFGSRYEVHPATLKFGNEVIQGKCEDLPVQQGGVGSRG